MGTGSFPVQSLSSCTRVHLSLPLPLCKYKCPALLGKFRDDTKLRTSRKIKQQFVIEFIQHMHGSTRRTIMQSVLELVLQSYRFWLVQYCHEPFFLFPFYYLNITSVKFCNYRVIHKSLRDFRPLRYRSRDGHAEEEHVNRGRTLQVSVLPYRCSICPPLVTRHMSNL